MFAQCSDFSPNLFWDANPDEIDFGRNKKYVVQRVIERGTLDDMRHIFALYGFDDVVDTSKTLRTLDRAADGILQALYGGSFRCQGPGAA